MRLPSAVIVAGILAVVAAPGVQCAIEGRGRLITVSVAVGRADGAPVEGLRSTDFEVERDGERRPVEVVSAAPVPLSIVILFDVTASANLQAAAVNRATDAVIGALKPGDRARLGVIAGTPALGPPLTDDAGELRKAARALWHSRSELFGPSPLWDAIDLAAVALQSEPGRRVVVAVSDGRTTGNRRSLADTSVSALTAGVSVNVVALASGAIIPQANKTAARVRPAVFLQQIADDTGGVCLFDRSGLSAKPGPLMARIIHLWQKAYTVGFAAELPDGRPHRLQIRVTKPEVTVRAPKAYLERF